MKINFKKGFTLIELLVVVSIIGVLATVVLSSLDQARSRARDAQRISELRQFQTSLELYYLDNNEYPPGATLGGCPWAAPLAPMVSGGYVSTLPIDPQNSLPFCYNYMSGGNPSQWSCDGTIRTEFEYAIFFSLENPNSNVDEASVNSTFTHCITGDLL